MKTEIKFNKYQKRGAYHWGQVSFNLFRFNAFVTARYAQVVKALPAEQDLKILDVGCGDGVLMSMLTKANNGTVTGIDTDGDSLAAARQKLSRFGDRVKLVEASGYSLPFAANQFDVVIATEVIEHLQYTDSLLTEIKRVLKPGGQVIITTPIKTSDLPEDPMHVQEFTPQEMRRLMEKHFVKVSIFASHPFWLKKIYLLKLGKFSRFHLEPFRWLINVWVLVTRLNPFTLSLGQNTNQLALGYK